MENSIGIETFGKNAVVCGRSKNVGMPIAMLLHADGIYETKAGLLDFISEICFSSLIQKMHTATIFSNLSQSSIVFFLIKFEFLC